MGGGEETLDTHRTDVVQQLLETSTQEKVFEEMLDRVVAVGHISKRDRTTMRKLLIEREVQTRAQVEDALALNLGDVEGLCGLPEGYLDTRVIPFQPKLSDM